MKLSFNLKDKSAEFNVDAEKLIEKKIDMSANIEKPVKKQDTKLSRKKK